MMDRRSSPLEPWGACQAGAQLKKTANANKRIIRTTNKQLNDCNLNQQLIINIKQLTISIL